MPQVHPGQPMQSFDRIGDTFERGVGLGHRFLHPLLEDRDQQIVFILEVQIHRASRHAGLLGNVGYLGMEESSSGEELGCGAQNQLPLVGGGGLTDGATAGGSNGHGDLMNECSFI